MRNNPTFPVLMPRKQNYKFSTVMFHYIKTALDDLSHVNFITAAILLVRVATYSTGLFDNPFMLPSVFQLVFAISSLREISGKYSYTERIRLTSMVLNGVFDWAFGVFLRVFSFNHSYVFTSWRNTEGWNRVRFLALKCLLILQNKVIR